jgi:hypothetical protein
MPLAYSEPDENVGFGEKTPVVAAEGAADVLGVPE